MTTTDPGADKAEQALQFAREFHDTYERLAPQFGYETRQDTRMFDPESPNGRLMVAVCAALTHRQQGVVGQAEVRTFEEWLNDRRDAHVAEVFHDIVAHYSAALTSAPPAQPQSEQQSMWDGTEEWMPLAWQLCADECGEEACYELVWEGGPVPEPWGERWLKYEDEAKRLIALVRKHVPLAAQPPERAAQQEAQEAVAYVDHADGKVIWKGDRLPGGSLLFAASPPRAVEPMPALTDEQINEALQAANVAEPPDGWDGYDIQCIRAYEAARGIGKQGQGNVRGNAHLTAAQEVEDGQD